MKRMGLSFLALLLAGCSLLLGGVEIESVALSAQKPSNVAAYVWVARDGEPLTELTVNSFRIYENDQLLTPDDIGLTLLDRTTAAEHHTVLLVDLGTEDAAQRQQVAQAVPAFVRMVRREQGVTIFAFDGGERLQRIGEFPREADATAPEQIPALESFQPRDTSRDLNGAVVQGLEALDAALMRAQKPVRVGTLMVFTRGPDLAGRVADAQLYEALESTKHQVLAMGIGEADQPHLDRIGISGTLRAQSLDALAIGFENAAAKVDAALSRHYLLSYCSPARAGRRVLRIEVSTVDEEGQEQVGSLDLEFDSTGFGPGCDPRSPPRFVPQPLPDADEPNGDSVTVGTEPAPAPVEPATEEAPQTTDEVVPPPDRPGYGSGG